MFKINILILAIVLFIGLPVHANSKSNGFTAIVYIKPGESLLSNNPSTLFVERGNVGVISRPITESRKLKYQVDKFNNQDFYLTISYSRSTNQVLIYNHTKKIGTIPLVLFDLDLNVFLNDLRKRYSEGDITYYKDYKTVFSTRQIKTDYERNYSRVRYEWLFYFSQGLS